jgi:uncharacterized membrane protein
MMTQPPQSPPVSLQERTKGAARLGMELVVSYILLGGVLLSTVLIIGGLVWHWAAAGHLQLDYSIVGMNFFRFFLVNIQQLVFGAPDPRSLVNTGISVLMLTPYVRVLASMLYFAFVERNGKYAIFTSLVLGVLTYSLFLR